MKALQALKVRSVKNLEGEDDYRHLEAFCRLEVRCLCTRLDRDCIGQFCLVNDFKIIKGWRKSHNIQLTRGYFCTSAVPWVFLLSGCHIFVYSCRGIHQAWAYDLGQRKGILTCVLVSPELLIYVMNKRGWFVFLTTHQWNISLILVTWAILSSIFLSTYIYMR